MILLVDERALQILAVPHTTAPERDKGLFALLLQGPNDVCRTVAAVRSHLLNCDPVPLLNPLQLLEVGLIVVAGTGRHMGVQDDAAFGLGALVHFVLELLRSPSLLGQGRIGVGATAVSLIRDFACRRRIDGLGSPLERFGFVTGLFGVVVNQRIQGRVGGDQCGIGHDATLRAHQPSLLADLHDPSEKRLEDLLAVTVADTTERRVIRHLVIQRQSAEPSIGEVVMDVFAELSVRSNVVEVSHQQHPEKDLRIDRRSSNSRRIARGRQFPNERRLQNPIDLPQQVILLDERLQVDCDHRTRIEDMQSLHVRLPTLNNRANWLNGRRSYRPLDRRIKINRL